MLTIENISYAYSKNRKPVLENYSLHIPQGSICGLLGRNGAGKSTLLYLICGLLRAKSGNIEYNGFNPADRQVDFLNDVFIVPEEFYLPPMKLKEYVASYAPFYPKFSMDDLEKYLETFEMTPDVHLSQLSMGQKKRVFISFALACNTSLLILDEPTNGLDIPGKRLFRKAMLSGMNEDKTIIISTHQVYDVEKIIDHVVITDSCGVLLDATITDIMSKLNFGFTTDKNKASEVLISLDAPGGYNIIEISDGSGETEVNLESLFELTRNNPGKISQIFENNVE